jgi:preprotein translocase subunit SecF
MAQTKFFEVIRPDHNFEFVGNQRLLIAISVVLISISFLFLPLNKYALPGRGSVLNWSIEFRGGTEMTVEFSRDEQAGAIREALSQSGFKDAEVVTLKNASQPYSYILRFGAVSALGKAAGEQLQAAATQKFGDALRRFEFSEGGDKIYLRFNRTIEPDELAGLLKQQAVAYAALNRFGRAEDNTFEVVLVSVNEKVKASLDQRLGPGTVKQILGSDSVGAKAGSELRDDGIKSLLAAIMFIMLYIAVRFDFTYGPGTVVALLHDAILVMGAFAVTYKEFSLTTVAAILTVIGYSMNDTIVVFDRIRENASRLRDKRFDRVVNESINETLSRTILTSLTVFLVTLCMNVLGTGTIRDFAFAMNVGVIVGTYSSIFIAAPILIALHNRLPKKGAKPARAGGV